MRAAAAGAVNVDNIINQLKLRQPPSTADLQHVPVDEGVPQLTELQRTRLTSMYGELSADQRGVADQLLGKRPFEPSTVSVSAGNDWFGGAPGLKPVNIPADAFKNLAFQGRVEEYVDAKLASGQERELQREPKGWGTLTSFPLQTDEKEREVYLHADGTIDVRRWERIGEDPRAGYLSTQLEKKWSTVGKMYEFRAPPDFAEKDRGFVDFATALVNTREDEGRTRQLKNGPPADINDDAVYAKFPRGLINLQQTTTLAFVDGEKRGPRKLELDFRPESMVFINRKDGTVIVQTQTPVLNQDPVKALQRRDGGQSVEPVRFVSTWAEAGKLESW